MRNILFILILISGFVSGQNSIYKMNAYISDWIIYKGDTLAVTAVAHAAAWDTLFVTKGSILDTVIVSSVRELDNLSDVVLTTPDASDILMLDDETQKWVNYPFSNLIGDINDSLPNYWYLDGDTIKTIYNVVVDSSFLMKYGNWTLGYDGKIMVPTDFESMSGGYYNAGTGDKSIFNIMNGSVIGKTFTCATSNGDKGSGLILSTDYLGSDIPYATIMVEDTTFTGSVIVSPYDVRLASKEGAPSDDCVFNMDTTGISIYTDNFIEITCDSIVIDELQEASSDYLVGWNSLTKQLVAADTALVTELDGLSDVTLTTPDASDMLILDDETMKWVNRPLIQVYDSMQHEAAAAPTPYATWKRDATNEQLEVANETDKIKEVYVSDKRNQGLITFSFDDGFMTDYTIMKPLFLAKGVPATSNIIQIKIGDAGCMDWVEIEALQNDGWEICSHGIDAARCDTLTEAELEYVMKASRDTLVAHGMKINTFVYAGGRYSDTAMMVARKYYRAARSTIMYSPAPVEDNPFIFNDNVLKTYALTSVLTDDPADSNDVYNYIDSAAVNKLWLIFYIHETNSADSAIISNYIDYIQAKGDSLQIVTIDQALDIRGNQVDASDGFAVNGDHVKINGFIYKGFYPFIYTPGDTSVSNARNLFIGFAGNQTLSPAGGAVTLASGNNAIGFDALKLITTGYNNSVFGNQTMKKTTTGYQNSAYGNGTLWSNTDGYSNTAIGFRSLYYNATGYQNTAIGLNSGYYSTASNNTFVGVSSGYGAASGCTGQNNAVLGALALEKFTGADGNTAVGYGAMNATTSGDYNTAIGNSALFSNTSGGLHVAIGHRAGRYCVTTNANVIIGADAGMGANGTSTYGYSTILGYKAGYSLTTGNYNTLLGYNAGYTLSTGASNVLVGYSAGKYVTGSNKLVIDNADRTNYAGDTTMALVFGNFATKKLKINGAFLSGTGSIADNDSTPSVASYNTFIYAGSANPVSIDALDDHVVGCYYTIIGNSNTYTITVIDGTPAGGDSFNLAGGNWVGGSHDVLLLYCIAADAFVEVSRSDN